MQNINCSVLVLNEYSLKTYYRINITDTYIFFFFFNSTVLSNREVKAKKKIGKLERFIIVV